MFESNKEQRERHAPVLEHFSKSVEELQRGHNVAGHKSAQRSSSETERFRAGQPSATEIHFGGASEWRALYGQGYQSAKFLQSTDDRTEDHHRQRLKVSGHSETSVENKERFSLSAPGKTKADTLRWNPHQPNSDQIGPIDWSKNPQVIGWGNSHGVNRRGEAVDDSMEFAKFAQEMQNHGVRTLGMEFLDKKGESLANEYLKARDKGTPAEVAQQREKLVQYLMGQFGNSDRAPVSDVQAQDAEKRRLAESQVRIMEIAHDHGMRVVGLEPDVDSICSRKGAFQHVHDGLARLKEKDRDQVRSYLADGNQMSREGLAERLTQAGMSKADQQKFFDGLDQMRMAKLQLPEGRGNDPERPLAREKDTDEDPDQDWSRQKQEWRNNAMRERVQRQQQEHPGERIVVNVGLRHLEKIGRSGNARPGTVPALGDDNLSDKLRALPVPIRIQTAINQADMEF